MARGVNKVILVGRLGGDPEVRYTSSGTAMVQFNVATNEPFKTEDGKWEERAEWHIEREVVRQHQVRILGRTTEIRERYYAISAERRVKHPAVVAMTEAARSAMADAAPAP